MNKYRKLGKDFLFMLLGSMGSRLLAFLIVPFYTAVLTTEEYGVADLISTTVTLLFPFFTLIICESMLRFALDQNNDPREVWRVGCRVWLFGLCALLVLSPLALLTPLREYYALILLYYAVFSAQQCVSYYVRGINRVKVFSVSGVVQTFVTVALNLLFLLWLRLGVWGYLLASVGGAVASTVYMLRAAEVYRYGFSLKINDRALWNNMLRYSIPMIPNSVSWWIANASDRYILTAFAGAAVTGVYSIAYKIPTLVSTVSNLFVNAWKLSAAEAFGTEESGRFYSDVYAKLSALMCLMMSFLFLINKPLCRFLFSGGFYEAWRCVPILLAASVFHSYCGFWGTVYTSAYRTKFIAVTTAVGALTNILLNFLLIPRWGAVGAALATLIGYAVVWLGRLLRSRAFLKIRLPLARNAAAYAILGAQMLVACREVAAEYRISALCCAAVLLLMRGEIRSFAEVLFKRLRRGDRP